MRPQTKDNYKFYKKKNKFKKTKIVEFDHEKTTEIILEKFYTGTNKLFF